MSVGSPKPLIISCAPSAANARAIARPMPDVEPVTRAVFPLRIMAAAMAYAPPIATVTAAEHLASNEETSHAAGRRAGKYQLRRRDWPQRGRHGLWRRRQPAW